ncbi:hypothetical protein J3B02_002667 [Coemansia erecta]|nr:hypothetical protein J3B02_002667 [Coemansia erecta]
MVTVETSSINGQKNKSSGIFQDVINSIFEPGVNRGVIFVMNAAFAGLFLILFYLLFATSFNIHVCALTLIAAGLFASIQWFIRELAVSKSKSKSKNSELKSAHQEPVAKKPSSLSLSLSKKSKLKKL